MINKRSLTPLLMITVSLLAVIPESTSILVHAQGTPTLAVNPSFNAVFPGQTFTVSVDLQGVDNLIAYDVIIGYDPASLAGVSIQCTGSGTIFDSLPSFQITRSIDNIAGEAECAYTLLGTTTAGSGSLMFVTFQSLGPFPSDLTIVQDSLHPEIVNVVNGQAQRVTGIAIFNGQFLSPPPELFVKPNATVAPGERVSRLSRGDTTVDLQGFIQLSPTAPAPGFGGVIFTIVDPAGNSIDVPSTINFMFPGNSTTVTAQFNFVAFNGGLTGTYVLFATLQECPTLTACVSGGTVQGLFFKVKA